MSSNDPQEVLSRPSPPPDVTLRYGGEPEQVVDLRWPTAEPSEPACLVIVVHGGFWRAEFDRQHTGPLSVGLAAAGYAVATIEYRRTGQSGGGWPGTFEDVDTALNSVPRLVAAAAVHRAGRSVDVGRTALVGHSAGGHLAAWAATSRRAGIVGVLSLAGVLDLGLAASMELDPGVGGPAVEALLGGRPSDVPDRYAATDPARLGPPAVPVVAIHGSDDTTVPIELSQSYTTVNHQQLVVLTGVEHYGLIDPQSPAWPEVLRHLKSALARPAQ